MVWWRHESRFESNCRLIKLFANCLLDVTENIDRCHDCFISRDVLYKVGASAEWLVVTNSTSFRETWMRLDLQTCGRNTVTKGSDGLLQLLIVTTITLPHLRVYVITSIISRSISLCVCKKMLVTGNFTIHSPTKWTKYESHDASVTTTLFIFCHG
jgi:hypothetical protein